MENTLVITIGISGSGKSTYVKNHFAKEYIVSTDAIRLQLTGDINNQSENEKVFRKAFDTLKAKLPQADVVFDATNVELQYLDQLISEIDPKKIKFLVFDTTLEVCKTRVKKDIANGKIRAAVPDEVIENQYKKFLKVQQYLHYYTNNIVWIKQA